MPSAVNSLIDRMLDRENQLFPVRATFMGIHDYDEDWGNPGNEGLEELDDFVREYTRLVRSQTASATGNDATDLALAQSHLAEYSITIQMMDHLLRNPLGVPSTIINGIFIMVVRNYAPLNDRMDAIMARLGKVPAYCKEAIHIYQRPVDRYVEMTVEMVEHGNSFLSAVVPQVAREAQYKYANELESIAIDAARALEEFASELKSLPTTPNFLIGEGAFNRLLKEHHLLDYNCESLLDFGWDQLSLIDNQMSNLAEKIKPGATPIELIQEFKGDHPGADELLDFYREWMEHSRNFVIENELCGIPENEILEVIPTPDFERSTIPYAAYMSPAPYEAEQKGFFYVTLVDSALSPQEQQQKLEGHNRNKVPIVALHEGYPGHHLQLCLANQQTSRIRRECDSTVFAEGWALYCEEMMKEHGFYTNDTMILGQLNDVQWRAARVVVDVSLHTGKMNFDEAVAFMMERAHLEKVNAEAEVKRYIYTPTQPMSYLVGKHEIVKLKDAFFIKHPQASLRSFHDKLLGVGTVPVSIAHEDVLR